MRGLIFVVTACLYGTSVAAAQTTFADSCVQSSADGALVGLYNLVHDSGRRLCIAASEDADGTIVPCLRIGRLYVGQSREDVEQALGEPWRRLEPRAHRIATDVYLLFRDTVTHRSAYYVVEYELADGHEIAYSIQLTGDRPDERHTFACLSLGDGEELVRRQLGTPTDVTDFEFREESVRGLVWWYEPDPVSVEVVDSRAYSFRVWRPDGIEAKRRTLRLIQGP